VDELAQGDRQRGDGQAHRVGSQPALTYPGLHKLRPSTGWSCRHTGNTGLSLSKVICVVHVMEMPEPPVSESFSDVGPMLTDVFDAYSLCQTPYEEE